MGQVDFRFYSAPQCSHCKRCTSYGNSVRPSVCLSHAGIVSKQLHVARCSLHCQIAQAGQHPLTGQRPANLRLLANQWAERRLVTQWRHRCRAMRPSECNAGASNAGRSLCVQISRERSYPMPIYWYHSKGNWLRYNLAAENFYV